MKRLLPLAWTAMIWVVLPASGTQISSQTAAKAAQTWLKQPHPAGATISGKPVKPTTRKDKSGNTLYHVINLQPEGYIIVAGDDWSEPIIAFSPTGQWTTNTGGPLTAMLDKDMRHRVAMAKSRTASAAKLNPMKAKWAKLTGSSPILSATSITSQQGTVTDVRVAPLVASRWSQTVNQAGASCFNYYVPPYSAGSVNNYPCGCVATAMAQVMRYYQYPTVGVGTPSFQITVDGATQTRNLRGGNGSGGAYQWGSMPLVSSSSDPTQCQAIGALLYDSGVAVNMMYSASGSGSYGTLACQALGSTFKFKNAINTSRFSANIGGTNLYAVLNPNLDAGAPVMLSIENGSSGHEVVCDGYGYLSGTMYHHVNLGWQGTADAWYTLPTIDTGAGITFTLLDDCTYNIFTDGTGEIISGRVVDLSGNPISGVTITASTSGQSDLTATTSAQGIYAFRKVKSSTSYSVTAVQMGYASKTNSAQTGLSQSTACGNVWGCDFKLAPTGVSTIKPSIITNPLGTNIAVGSSYTMSVSANGDYLAYQWSKGSTKIPGANSSSFTIPSATTNDAGTYTVTLTNSLGVATSSGAIVTVATPPVITAQPAGAYVKVGSTYTLSVNAIGTGLTYQWMLNGSAVGGNSSKYVITSAKTQDSGTYSVAVTNIAGSMTSSSATISVLNPPAIATAPVGGNVPKGGQMTVSVSATGDQIRYQWKKGSTAIAGATGSTYTITNAQLTDSSAYSVTVTNQVATVTASANVTVVAPPAVTVPVAKVTLLPGLTTTLKVSSTGTGTMSYQWSLNGQPISGATTNSYIIDGAQNADAGTYTVAVSNFGGTTQTNILAVFAQDTNAPTIALSGSIGTFTNNTITIAGKASDNVAVASVNYSLNGSDWVQTDSTNGYTNWSAQITLPNLGTNVLLLSATDINGNNSKRSTNYAVYAPFYTATVTVTGSGSVKTSWTGTKIQYGKSYTVTAVNGPNYTLQDWSGDVTTNVAVWSFIASGDIALTADFVPNLFLNSGGAYNGLFTDAADGPSHANTGFWSSTVTTNLTYSAKVLLAGDTLSFSGSFSSDGTLVQTVPRKGKSSLQLNLVMDFGNKQITGTISADNWSSTLQADQAIYSAKATTPNAGAFTFVFPVSDPGLGFGSGQVTVSTNGTIAFVGTAPDGASASQSVPISKDGYWPLFVPLYMNSSTNRGELFGWLNFSSGALSGTVNWLRPSGMAPYTGGFTNTSDVESAVFTPPTKAAPKELPFKVGQIAFTGGGLTAPFTELFLVATNGSIYTEGASQLKINANGQITGSVADPATGKSVNLTGIVLQTENAGKGSILGTNQLGEFTISAY